MLSPTRPLFFARAALAAAAVFAATSAALAGHGLGHFPSYYPDEIVIETVDAAVAAQRLTAETLHAHIGAPPAFAGPVPPHVRAIDSLDSLLVLSFDTGSPAHATAERRCADARDGMVQWFAAKRPGVVFHPYPITPFHADYIHHADVAEAAIAAAGAASSGVSGGGAGVAVAEVPALDGAVGGWFTPPWAKQGWHQAYRVLAPSLDAPARRAADEIYQSLVRGAADGLVEQIRLERRLIAALTAGCQRMVIGYSLRREYVNEATSAGAENMAYDSQAGLATPVLVRTAKLKDFPWNGSLRLGVGAPPTAAWNPVAGFSDAGGQLIWSAMGDPAMLPIPYNAEWTPNRVQVEVATPPGNGRNRAQTGGVRVPDDALFPEPGSGALKRLAAPTFASSKATYEAVGSPYLDGSEIDMADVIYPFAFAYRWGGAVEPGQAPRDPALAMAFDLLRDRLVGLRPLRVKRTSINIAENLDAEQRRPVVEVFLRDVPGDDNQVAALAPPWSAVPWHLLALMEAAVERGYAAFSANEASRRGVAWLDLARDPALRQKLLELCAAFERERFRPAALAPFVTGGEAAKRWRAVAAFAKTHGHFLVTNGPYRLKSWAADSTVLTAVREMTYPIGFGTFDHLANPPQAVIQDAAREPGAIMVRADADITVKVGRRREVRREPLSRTTAQGMRGVLITAGYVLIGPDGAVTAAGRMNWEPDNRFRLALPKGMPGGAYTAMVGVFLNGNTLPPAVRVFAFEGAGRN